MKGRKNSACRWMPLAMGLLLVPHTGMTQPITARPAAAEPVVIAVIESGGLNVLHEDFRTRSPQPPAIAKSAPPREMVTLPGDGDFERRLELARRGPLGNLDEGTLYGVRDSRIVGIYVPPGSRDRDLFEDRVHPTGTTSAAVGLRHGTNPDALLVYVTDPDRAAWSWLARQQWIDIVSTSYFTLVDTRSGFCHEARFIRRIVDQGRVVFSAAGNAEQAGIAHAPSGVPQAYQVGGVDDKGQPYLPDPDDGFLSTPTRPYETGDRFSFPAASSEASSGSMPFGGTSGATPSTAGRAARLIQVARSLLDSHWSGVRDGALAIAGPNAVDIQRGPLKDGRFTAQELADLLHRVAVPNQPPSPLRYLIEGYGALSGDAIRSAEKILAGTATAPERGLEDQTHSAVEQARKAAFPAARCS